MYRHQHICFVNNKPSVLSESKAYKFRGCEGRAAFQARNGAERNFVHKTTDELRTGRAVNKTYVLMPERTMWECCQEKKLTVFFVCVNMMKLFIQKGDLYGI